MEVRQRILQVESIDDSVVEEEFFEKPTDELIFRPNNHSRNEAEESVHPFNHSSSRSSTHSACPICSKTVTTRNLKIHIRTHDDARERSFMCEICPKTFLSKHELIIHRRNHLNIRPFSCDFDGLNFTSKSYLTKHIQLRHLKIKPLVEYKISCSTCEKRFPYQSKMMQHFKKAHPEGSEDGVKVNPKTNHFHCSKCNLEFLTKYRIDNHICLVFADGATMKHQCPVCFLSCRSRPDLLKHLYEHGEKLENRNWRCKVCLTVVHEKITAHIENTHSVESVSCGMCNKKLKNQKSLR